MQLPTWEWAVRGPATASGRRAASPEGGERGGSIILALILTFLVFMLAASLLSVTDVEFAASKSNTDSLAALNDADDAVSEAIWRLNLKPGTTAPPAGSRVSVNNLSNYDASLRADPWNLLGNLADDDGDGEVDEPDELNFNREWTARILLSPDVPSESSPWEVPDTDALTGPPWGAKQVKSTVQPSATWKEYSTADVTSAEVLTVRFKLDTDTTVGDSEGDGAEIVFWDQRLVRNPADDRNTLVGLGGNGNPNDDSPYNITWSDGAITVPATGAPVLLVDATAKVRRAGRVVGKRKIEAEVAYPVRSVMGYAVCGCSDATVGGYTDSYSSSEGEYNSGPVYQNGDVGSNANLSLGTVRGDADAGGNIDGAGGVTGDATAGGWINGNPGQVRWPNYVPAPEPCLCDALPVDALVTAAATTNDNATLAPGCQGPNLNLNGSGSLCTFDSGTYYFVNIEMSGNAEIRLGDISAGPVTIYVSGSIDIQGNAIINHPGRPYDLRIISNGTVGTDSGGTPDIGATIYAPHTDCNLHGNPNIYGAVLCRTVDMDGNTSTVHYDEDLGGIWHAPGRFKVIAWREVE